MVEVKSSGALKGYHRDDAAIQAFAARGAGVPLQSIALANVDTSWVYPGDEDYDGLLVEEDLTDEAFARGDEVADWIAACRKIAARKQAPEVEMGRQCGDPYPP